MKGGTTMAKRIFWAMLMAMLAAMLGACGVEVLIAEPNECDEPEPSEPDASAQIGVSLPHDGCLVDDDCPTPPDSICQVARCDITGKIWTEGMPRGCSWVTAPVGTECRWYPTSMLSCPGTCQLGDAGATFCHYIEPVNCGGG